MAIDLNLFASFPKKFLCMCNISTYDLFIVSKDETKSRSKMKLLIFKVNIILFLTLISSNLSANEILITGPQSGDIICSDSHLMIEFQTNDFFPVNIYLYDVFLNERYELVKFYTGSQYIWPIDAPQWFDRPFSLIVEASDDGEIRAKVDDIKIVHAPKIISQTQSALVCYGEQFMLRIEAKGTDLQFQWFRDGIPIQGANRTAIVFDYATHDLSGIYSCIVSSAYGCMQAESEPISVFVNTPTSFTVAPLGVQWFHNIDAEFKVGVHGLDISEIQNVKFQWYRDTLNVFTDKNDIIKLEDGSRYAGTKTDHLKIRALIYSDRGRYFCIAEGRCGKDTIYTFIGEDLFMKITNVGYNYDDCEGGTAILEIKVETLVDADIEYQWYNSGYRLIQESDKFVGTKTNRLQINNVQKEDGIGYYCRVSMPKYNLYQNSDIFTITPAYKPFITKQPTNYIVKDRDNLYYGQVNVNVFVNSNRLMKFEWYRNDTLVRTTQSMSGSDYWLGPNMVPRPAQLTDVGTYWCIITHPCDTLYTDTVRVIWGYDDIVVCEFEKVSLEVEEAPGNEDDYIYIWYKNGKPFIPNFRIKGNGTHKLDFSWVISDDMGAYGIWRQSKITGKSEYLGKIYLEVKIAPKIVKQFQDTIYNDELYIPRKNCAVFSHGPILYSQLYFNDKPFWNVEERHITDFNEKYHAFYVGGYKTNLPTGTYKYKFWNDCGETWTDPFVIINTAYKPGGEVYLSEDEYTASSVEGISDYKVVVYPNPAKDMVYIAAHNFSIENIRITDILGREQLNFEISSISTSINTHKLPKGMYFVQIYGNNRVLIEKLIIE